MVTHQSENIHLAHQYGELELKGQFTFGSNYTFLVTVHYEGKESALVVAPLPYTDGRSLAYRTTAGK